MAREPDWEALRDLHFLLSNRIADSLNAALSAIALSDMPEAQDKPPGFWKNRAANKIANVLNLNTAWSYLIRFKLGETIPEGALRPFSVNTLLYWLAQQIQLVPPPSLSTNPRLHANQETLQEALLLIYSAAHTQGTNVLFELEATGEGVWFRVKFSRLTPIPATLDEMLNSFGDHWRDQDMRFELTTARDFIRLNGSDLLLTPQGSSGEFAFFIRSAGAKTGEMPQRVAAAVPANTPVFKDTPAPAPVEIVESKEAANTPVIQEPPKDPASAIQVAPPTLAMLRPLPHHASRPPQPAEGMVPPGEPAQAGGASSVEIHSPATPIIQTETPEVRASHSLETRVNSPTEVKPFVRLAKSDPAAASGKGEAPPRADPTLAAPAQETPTDRPDPAGATSPAESAAETGQ